jgi:hypothetical protein
MGNEQQKINPDQQNFLKEHEALLERAKKGDVQALAELKKGTGSMEVVDKPKNDSEPVTQPVEELKSDKPFISSELKPDHKGLTPIVKEEEDTFTKEVLAETLNGLDINDPDAVTKTLMKMAKRKAERDTN